MLFLYIHWFLISLSDEGILVLNVLRLLCLVGAPVVGVSSLLLTEVLPFYADEAAVLQGMNTTFFQVQKN